jgi:hypothetical protein
VCALHKVFVLLQYSNTEGWDEEAETWGDKK